jgi:protein associated with RNAse G/E
VADELARQRPRRVRLDSVKWGGVPHRTWESLWELESRDRLVLWGPDGTRVREADGRVWIGPRPVLMYFWPDCDFNVVTLVEGDGRPRHYCNICLPAEAVGGVAGGWRYVDLDLDVIVRPDGSVEVRDEDEFVVNADRFGYPEEIRRRAREGLAAILRRVAAHQGPFAPHGADPWLAAARHLQRPPRS